MSEPKKTVTILMAEDDIEDQMMVKEAFEEARLVNKMDIVENGEELMDYLQRKGKYTDSIKPDIILLDLNMPKKSGLEALKEMREDTNLRNIPVIVLTTSKEDEDMIRSFDLGVNLYINKPVTFGKLVEMVKWFGRYWIEIVQLPALNE